MATAGKCTRMLNPSRGKSAQKESKKNPKYRISVVPHYGKAHVKINTLGEFSIHEGDPLEIHLSTEQLNSLDGDQRLVIEDLSAKKKSKPKPKPKAAPKPKAKKAPEPDPEEEEDEEDEDEEDDEEDEEEEDD